MGKILDMALHKMKKLDCQGENANGPERSVRATEAAQALSVCVNLMRAEFGDHFAMTNLSNELLNIRFGRK